jgi:hypothetical protein
VTFTLDQLQEFRFLRRQTRSLSSAPSSTGSGSSAHSSSKASRQTYEVSRDVFDGQDLDSSPFDFFGKEEEFVEDVWDDEDCQTVDSDSDPEELKVDFWIRRIVKYLRLLLHPGGLF